MSTNTDTRNKRRFLIFSFGAIALALVASVFWARWRAEQLALELVALRAEINAGDSPLEREPGPPVATSAADLEPPWYSVFAYEPGGLWHDRPSTNEDFEVTLQRVRSELIALGLQEELQRVEPCLDEESVGRVLRAAFARDLYFIDPQSWTTCQRDFVALLGRLDPRGLESALQASRLEPQSGEDWLPRDLHLSQANPFPQLPVLKVMQALQRLVGAAELASASGDWQAAASHLTAALNCAQLFGDGRWLFAHLAWLTSVTSALDGLRRVLPLLPAEADLQSFEAQLESMHALDAARNALLGERALIDRVFVVVSDRALQVEGERQAREQLAQLSDLYGSTRAHLHYLEATEQCLATLELSWPQVGEALPDFGSGRERLSAELLLSHWPDLREATAVLDSERLKALAALRAQREGVAAARAWLEQRVDPLTDSPFVVREEPDGALSVLRAQETSASNTWRLAPAGH